MKSSIFLIVGLLLTAAGCVSTDVEEPAEPTFARTAVAYFPAGTFDDFRTDWFATHLAEMGEPSFLDDARFADGVRVYRFTWLSTFHGNLVVRVQMAPGMPARISAKRYDGGHSTGWRAGRRTYEDTHALTKEEERGLRAKLETAGLREMAASGPQDLSGLDGSVWLFEWRTPEGRGVAARWSPTAVFDGFSKEDCKRVFPKLDYEKHKAEYARFVELCNGFQRLSGLNVELY